MRDIYADESSQTAHRFLVLGAVSLPTDLVDEAVRQLQAARLPSLPRGEMKWTKVSAAKLSAYRGVIDMFFDMSARDMIHFHSLIVDTWGFDHTRFNDGDREIGFSKMVFQLLAKHYRLYPGRLYAYLDSRTTRQSLDNLRDMLNRHARKRGREDFPFRRVVFRDSKESDLLQLNDILLGSIAWIKNGHGLKPEASKAKTSLAAHVMQRAGLQSLDRDTPFSRNSFTVWNFRLS